VLANISTLSSEPTPESLSPASFMPDFVISGQATGQPKRTKLVILFDGTTNEYSDSNGTKFRGSYEDRCGSS
jgi:hypothetical protein